MPRSSNPGGAWNESDKVRLVRELMSGALSVNEACARHSLSQDCLRDWVRMFRHSTIEAFDEHLRQTLVTQGIAVGDALPAGFNGSLSDITLADLIQTITLARRDSVITVLQDGIESRIWCAGGEIVDAESGRLHGEPALYRALALKTGRLIAEFVQAPRERRIRGTTVALLLNGARQMDECNVLLDRFGAGRYRRAPDALDAGCSSAEQALLHHFVVPRSLREALAESDMDDLAALTGIARLIERGALCPEVASPLPVVSRPPGEPSTAPMMLAFLRAAEDRSSVRPGLRNGWRLRSAALAALGAVAWFASSASVRSSGASGEAPTAAPGSPQAASVAALVADPRVPVPRAPALRARG
jgi:hypothetical protein